LIHSIIDHIFKLKRSKNTYKFIDHWTIQLTEKKANSFYLEISTLIKGLGRSEDSHFPGAKVVIDQFDPEPFDRFFLQALVLEG
jgi:hypothetical protein